MLRLKFLAVVPLLLMLSAGAHAERRYLLVGMRHVYDIPSWPDPNAAARKQAEEEYAQAVKAAQDRYDTSMISIAGSEAADNGAIHQGDRDAVQYQAEQDIEHAAETRDEELSKLYPTDDAEIQQYPDLAGDADGPYRVLALDLLPSPQVQDVEFLEPYPEFEGPAPFGWTYGEPHPWFQFTILAEGWHKRWASHGRPAFVGLYLNGHLLDVHVSVRADVIAGRKSWVSGAPPAFSAGSRSAFLEDRNRQIQAGLLREPSYAEAARERAASSPAPATRIPTPEEALRARRARIAAAHGAAVRASAKRQAVRQQALSRSHRGGGASGGTYVERGSSASGGRATERQKPRRKRHG